MHHSHRYWSRKQATSCIIGFNRALWLQVLCPDTSGDATCSTLASKLCVQLRRCYMPHFLKDRYLGECLHPVGKAASGVPRSSTVSLVCPAPKCADFRCVSYMAPAAANWSKLMPYAMSDAAVTCGVSHGCSPPAYHMLFAHPGKSNWSLYSDSYRL